MHDILLHHLTYSDDAYATQLLLDTVVAEKIIDIYKNILEWSLDFKSFLVPEEMRGLLNAASMLSETVIQDIENFIKDYNERYPACLLFYKLTFLK